MDWVLDVARAAVYRYGIRGLVIDPYNELDHQRPAAMSETEYVSQMLTKVKRFAQVGWGWGWGCVEGGRGRGGGGPPRCAAAWHRPGVRACAVEGVGGVRLFRNRAGSAPTPLCSTHPASTQPRPPTTAPRPQTTGVHVWFVAHPRQLREWKGQAPNLYDISGSAHFINKADNGIVVHRDRDPDSPDQHRVGGGGRGKGPGAGAA